MTIRDFIPLIATLIGGALAIIGGYVSNYLLQSRSRQAERRKVIHEKLEELYVLTIQVDDWLQHRYRQCISKVALQDVVDNNPITRLVMLVKLYEPSLSKDVESFAIQLENFRSNVELYLAKCGLEEEDDEAFINHVQEPLGLASKSQGHFMESIERVFLI